MHKGSRVPPCSRTVALYLTVRGTNTKRVGPEPTYLVIPLQRVRSRMAIPPTCTSACSHSNCTGINRYNWTRYSIVGCVYQNSKRGHPRTCLVPVKHVLVFMQYVE